MAAVLILLENTTSQTLTLEKTHLAGNFVWDIEPPSSISPGNYGQWSAHGEDLGMEVRYTNGQFHVVFEVGRTPDPSHQYNYMFSYQCLLDIGGVLHAGEDRFIITPDLSWPTSDENAQLRLVWHDFEQ